MCFQGVVFLTTKGLWKIDPIVGSLVDVRLKYPKLGRDARRRVWMDQTEAILVDGSPLSEAKIFQLAEENLNGKRIVRVVRKACMLARGITESGGLKAEHFDTALGLELAVSRVKGKKRKFSGSF
jgi:hypothetical protein